MAALGAPRLVASAFSSDAAHLYCVASKSTSDSVASHMASPIARFHSHLHTPLYLGMTVNARMPVAARSFSREARSIIFEIPTTPFSTNLVHSCQPPRDLSVRRQRQAAWIPIYAQSNLDEDRISHSNSNITTTIFSSNSVHRPDGEKYFGKDLTSISGTDFSL
jgi:hypothetical protein